MEKFDNNLLYQSEIMDTLLSPFGENAPKKILLVVDYQENRVNKNVDLVLYQYKGTEINAIICNLILEYAEGGKIITSIIEVDNNGSPMTHLYIAPSYLKEFIKE